MKIIQIMPEFGLAGAEIMCENLTCELKRLGHTVIVISMYDYHSAITERLETAGIDVRYLSKKPGLDISMIGKMRKIFKAEKPDAIHTHRYVMQYAIPAAILAGVKNRVHTVHNVATKENGKAARKLNKVFFKRFGVIPVALSSRVQETIVEEYHLPEAKIPVVFNGIDLSHCVPKTDYAIQGTFKILHIGRFSEAKNHIGLLKAFQIFHEKYPQNVLKLIGDGELKEEVERFVKENELSDMVEFLGLQANVYGFLNEADLFTLPSIYEGIPMTLIEAMGTGLPIVTTTVGGIPDMLDENSALLTEVDSKAVAEAFEKYYLDASLRQTHGENAKKRSEEFSSAIMAQKYLALYSNGDQ